jgi:hypothetical protein
VPAQEVSLPHQSHGPTWSRSCADREHVHQSSSSSELSSPRPSSPGQPWSRSHRACLSLQRRHSHSVTSSAMHSGPPRYSSVTSWMDPSDHPSRVMASAARPREIDEIIEHCDSVLDRGKLDVPTVLVKENLRRNHRHVLSVCWLIDTWLPESGEIWLPTQNVDQAVGRFRAADAVRMSLSSHSTGGRGRGVLSIMSPLDASLLIVLSRETPRMLSASWIISGVGPPRSP